MAAAVAADMGIGHDPAEPRLEVGARRERVKTAVRLDHRLLYQILGIRMIAAQAHGPAVQRMAQWFDVSLKSRSQFNRPGIRNRGNIHDVTTFFWEIVR
ncbi:uncharacterized protein RMCB_5907 [Mycolicibacterium brisbanense]|uniref:Uncharacterized protein n=1 Tax=Mycolicibacterium brisbanense TaxID=146020 RepID=A0A100W564_9MYCO|nr:uncharacterized protein RMCB_5907 [Mycolicibacterium brisbanense]